MAEQKQETVESPLIALITGGNKGIGFASCKVFDRE
jgi:hypothetical protein